MSFERKNNAPNDSKLFSTVAQSIASNPLRAVMEKAEGNKEILQLSGGKPPKEVFPVHSDIFLSLRTISTSLRPGFSGVGVGTELTEISLGDEDDADATASSEVASTTSSKDLEEKRTDKSIKNKSKLSVKSFLKGKSGEKLISNGIQGESDVMSISVSLDSDWALNYNQQTFSGGLPSFVEVCKEYIVKKEHQLDSTSWKDYDTCITSGATDGLAKIVELLTDPNDVLFMAKYSYPGLLACALPLGRTICPIEIDSYGMIPSCLEATFQRVVNIAKKFPETKLRPKLLYVIPNGQNPTTTTMPTSRKQEIYAICRKYDVYIVVDDPYYYLALGNKEDIARNRHKTFLELDTDRRVLRLDSFSKIIAPGFRLGLLTARKDIVEKFATYAQVTSWGLSGANQAIMEGILRKMGSKGFEEHISRLREVYTQRRDALVENLNKELVDENGNKVAEFITPSHGMFLWLKVPKVKDTKFLVDYLYEEKVSLVPGCCFSPVNAACQHFRVSFSCASAEELKIAAARIGTVLRNIDSIMEQTGAPRFDPNDNADIDVLDNFVAKLQSQKRSDRNRMLKFALPGMFLAAAVGAAAAHMFLPKRE